MKTKFKDPEKQRLLESPILVTGCARSGTSLIAGTLHFCGAWVGHVTGKTRHNQKGQFENNFIRDKIVKRYLTSIGADPLGQNPLPKIDNLPIDMYMGKKVREAMLEQGYDGQQQWLYKGAKMCLIWPVWSVAFQKAQWVIVRRKDEEIVRSCLRTAFMRKYKDAAGWHRWVDFHLARFEEMKQQSDNVMEVWPEKMFKGDFSEIKKVVANLGLDWNRETVHDFLDFRLWNKGKQYKEAFPWRQE